MSPVIAFLPLVLYAVALVLGIADVALPGGEAALTPLAQWMLLLSLGVHSLWAAFGHLCARLRPSQHRLNSPACELRHCPIVPYVNRHIPY